MSRQTPPQRLLARPRLVHPHRNHPERGSMTTTTYRTTVPLPKREEYLTEADWEAAKAQIIEKLTEYGWVVGYTPKGARWQIERSDEYVLAELVRDTEQEIAALYQDPIEIPRPRKVPAK